MSNHDAGWERDRAELDRRRRECATCGARNLATDGVHSCYDRNAVHAAEVAELRAELDRVTAQRDALVPLVNVQRWGLLTTDEMVAAAGALAAISAEREGRV